MAALAHLPPDHRRALDHLRAFPGFEDIPDAELLRFLRACKFRLEGVGGAIDRLRRTVAWRANSLPIGSAPDLPPLPQILAALAEKKWFEVVSKPTVNGRPIFYCPVRNLEKGRRAAPWRTQAPRCYGAPRLLEQMCAFFHLWEKALSEIPSDAPGDVVFVLNVRQVRRSPTAFIQRCTVFLGAHYPGRIHRIIVYPAPPRVEHVIRGMMRFADVGQVTESAPLVCLNTREALLKELSISSSSSSSSSSLSWADLPEDLRNTHPLPLNFVPFAKCPVNQLKGSSSPEPPAYCKARSSTFTTTPWYPQGVDCLDVSLEEELADFAAFVLLTPQERSRRLALRSKIQEAVESVCPGSTCKLVGPDSYGLTTTTDPVTLSIDDDIDISKVMYVAGLMPVPSPVGKFCTESGCGMKVELILGGAGRALRKSAPIVRSWLTEFAPGASTAYIVLRCVLSQSKYTDEATGGLGADALLMMVIHVCRRIRMIPKVPRNRRKLRSLEDEMMREDSRTLNGERVVRVFLKYFSEFDFNNFAVDPAYGEPTPKATSAPACIYGPIPGWNLAESCTRIQLVKQQLLYCKSALTKADAKAATTGSPPFSRTSLRTPLSSILCHDPLWLRRKDAVASVMLQVNEVPAPCLGVVDAMQGKWRDPRGVVFEVQGTAVRCGAMSEFPYQLAAPVWSKGIYLLGANTVGPSEDGVITWDDGDVWHRCDDTDDVPPLDHDDHPPTPDSSSPSYELGMLLGDLSRYDEAPPPLSPPCVS